MRILYVASRHLLHRGHPRVASITALLRWLAQDNDVYLVYHSRFDVSTGIHERIRGLRLVVRLPPGRATTFTGLARSLASRRPLQLALYGGAGARRVFLRTLEQANPSVVIYDTFRTLQYRSWANKAEQARHVLDLDDLFSERYRQAIRSIRFAEITGHAEMSRAASMAVGVLKRPVLAYETATLARLEPMLPTLFDAVVMVSQSEAATLRLRSGRSNSVGIPQFIPSLAFDDRPSMGTANNTAYFLGNFAYAPNVSTLERLLTVHVPGIRRRLPDFQLRVYGPNLSPRMGRRVHSVDGASYHGYVEDIRAAVADCRVFLSPITFGTGIKTKIVEAMSWQKAIVTNTVGTSGLDVARHGTCVITDDEERQISETTALLMDPQRAADLGKAAQDFVRARFAPNVLQDLWENVLETRKGP